MSGCLSEPGREGANGKMGVGSQSDPAMMCGPGRVVVGVDTNGQVMCELVKLSGQAAKTDESGNAECEIDQQIETTLVQARTGDLLVTRCDDEVADSMDTILQEIQPTQPFRCPPGSALKGFSEYGEPYCGVLVGDDLSEMAFLMPMDKCPYGMLSGSVTHSEFSTPICVYDRNSPKLIRLVDQPVTKLAAQNHEICQGAAVVVGFGVDQRVICGPPPSHLRRAVQRHWAIRFEDGHPERPLCRLGYLPVASFMRWADPTRNPLKIWTCDKAD
ncbi:MAG: hypothetical protein AB7N80_07305 [Bdellovibrionales bacterium]